MGGGAERAAWIVALAGAIVASCVVGGTFVCTSADECASGHCEANGFCSFADDACGSGRRYSEWAGDGLADACTPEHGSGSDSGSSSEGSSTTLQPDLGPPAVRDPSTFECGNGMLEVGEICDDGNLVDGDGCDADCVASGAVLWTTIEDGPNSGEDLANAVALVVGGNPIVTGRYGANAGDLFVKGYDAATGELLWSKLQGTSRAEEGRALATSDSSRFFVAGFNSAADDMGGENLFTRAYDLGRTRDPAIAWTKTSDDAILGQDRLNAASLRPDRDELVVFGFIRGPDDTMTHVRAYAVDDGTLTWNTSPDPAPGVAQLGDDARGGIVTSEGRVFVVGSVVDPGVGGRSDGWLAELDVSMSPDGLALGPPVRFGTPEATDVVSAIAEAPDGTLVVAGHRGQRGFFARYDRELLELGDYLPDPTSPSEVTAIAIDGTGAIVTAGYTTSDAHGRDIEVVKYLADGTRIWRDREDGEAGADDQGRGVAIAADDTIVVVGNLRRTLTGSDLWVRKYAP